MNSRIWITALALVWVMGCEMASEDYAPPAPESSLTRSCCDQELTDCVPEPEKACTEEDGRPVINWQ